MTIERTADSTCYIERSRVRQILIASDASNDATSSIWADIDKLPITTAGDFRTEAAAEIERLRERVADAEADAARLHKLATDRWEALLELKVRDDRNSSLPVAYREIIDRALNQQEVKR